MSAERSALHPEPDEILASEAGILGILIWLPDFAGPRLARVSAGMFRHARHQMIYEVVQRLHSERKAAGIAAVLESLKAANVLEAAGGAEYVKGMVDSAVYGGAYMFERYVASLRERISREGSEGHEEDGSSPLSVVSCEVGLDEVSDKVSDEGDKAIDKVTEQVGDKDTRAGEQPAEGGIGENELTVGARILQELRALFLRFVVLPPHAAEMLPLWTLHTYAWELRRVTTYLAIVSPEKRCGKTTLLSLMQTVVKRPQLASNISPPSIFHAIEEMRPALLIDEFDSFLQGKDELRGILNAGYTRDSAYVLRASGQGQKLRRFSCWCPKVIAGIGRLPETLADRCIVMTMRRKTDEEQCERFDEYDGTELRDRCERWVEENRYEIERRRPSIPKELNDRAADIWEPLLVLADLAGGPWPELARRAAVGLSTSGVEQDMTGMLLNDIRIVFRVLGSEKLFSRTLVEALLMLPERPWKEARRGGQINELWLAQRLAPFGIRSGTVRLGEETAKGYCLADFADTFARYLPKG